MFEKILFPTDFTTHAQEELECISGFPGVREIVLLHIIRKFPIPLIETTIANSMKEYLDEAKTYLETLHPGLTVTADMGTSTDVTGVILETAAKRNTDLIVISGYVKNFKLGVLLGRVPATVLCRISKTNVFVMPNRLIDTLSGETHNKFCRNPFSKILCPTDFSEFSKKAIASAGSLKGVREVILLHVLPATAQTPARHEAEARLAALRDMIASQGARVRIVVTAGEPASEIARVAEMEDVSVIWMSDSGKGCLHEFVSGSLVHDAVMNGKRPALIVRSVE
jgi:nucleotide-binding universal stress UspA family protein